jgi:hypothetical protein
VGVHVGLPEFASVAAALSAMAAAASAWNSRQGVDRAHRPFVYGEPALFPDDEIPVVRIALFSDGSAPGREVRTRLEAIHSNWSGEVAGPVRALPVGDTSVAFNVPYPPRHVEGYVCVVRYLDSFGRLWEVRNVRYPPAPMKAPKRVRRRKHKRAW